jgi:hypothetical protein
MIMYQILLIYVCCALVGLDNKDEINIVLDFVTPSGTLFFAFELTNFNDCSSEAQNWVEAR